MKITLKRSNVLDGSTAKAPTAAQMEYGEVAINYNKDDPSIFIKDQDNNIVKLVGSESISDTSDGTGKNGINGYWNRTGSKVVPVNIGDSIEVGSGAITLKPDGTATYTGKLTIPSSSSGDAGTSAVSKDYVDTNINQLESKYINASGDNMSGNLTFNTNSIVLATDGSAQFVGKLTTAATSNSDSSNTVVTKGYVDSNISSLEGTYVDSAGDNMTGNLTFDTNKIKLFSSGDAEFSGKIKTAETSITDSNDTLTTKGYIDTRVINIAGDYVNTTGDNMSGNLTLNTNKVVLSTNGTGTFLGKVTSDHTVSGDPGNTLITKSFLDTSIGSINSDYVSTGGDNINGDLTFNTSNIILRNNGTGSFAGKLSSVGHDVTVSPITVDRNLGSSNAPSIEIKSGGVAKSQLNDNGSAVFTGKIRTALTSTNDPDDTLTTKDYIDTRVSGLSGDYVKTGGDNMTGALTIAQNKIVLDVDGTAYYQGTIGVGGSQSSTSNITLYDSGAATFLGTVDATSLEASNITASNTVSAVDVTASNNVSAVNIAASGNATATNVTASSTVTAATVTSTGSISASNDISATNINASGTVSGSTITTTGNVSAVDVDASGDITAASITTSGNLSAIDIDSSGTVKGVNLEADTAVTATTYYGDGSNLTGIDGGVISIIAGANIVIDPPSGKGNVVITGKSGESNVVDDVSSVGTIVAWYGTTAPDQWLECNGQSTDGYPLLANMIGANVPDLRGEFLRGFDNGRGVDTGRALGSSQADEFKSHNHTVQNYGILNVNPSGGSVAASQYRSGGTDSTAIGDTGGTETRPRNVALMYIIRAVASTAGGGIGEAPDDGKQYVRQDGVWKEFNGTITGSIQAYGGSVAPQGWLECNGQPTTNYDDLAAVVGANVPDLRGQFIRGWDNGAGIDNTRQFGSNQGYSTALPNNPFGTSNPGNHEHPFGMSGGQYDSGGQTGGRGQGTGGGGAHTHSIGGGDAETRPVNVALMYIIKT
tara:strand:+ start:366 stop:3347 length:2982 start_codon:yes stop_codon:yes gene_type:complete